MASSKKRKKTRSQKGIARIDSELECKNEIERMLKEFANEGDYAGFCVGRAAKLFRG